MELDLYHRALSERLAISAVDENLSEIDIETLPQDVLFGNIMYEPSGSYGPRMQLHYQLVIINRGEAVIYVDGRKHLLQPGEVALLRPGHEEYFEFAQNRDTYHSWCHFYWQLPESFQRMITGLPFKALLSSRMERLMDLGLAVQHDPNSLSPSLAHLAAAAFWEYVAVSVVPPSQNTLLPDPIKRVQTYIATHYYLELNLMQLSRVAFVTPEHLVRLFREHLDITPMRYLWQIRTQQGVSYLKHTHHKVERIAYSCGFKTAAHFSRSVKNHTGQTPSEIRSSQLWQNA